MTLEAEWCNFRNGSNAMGPQHMSGWLDPSWIYGVYTLLDSHGVAYKVHPDGSGLETVRIDALVSNRMASPLRIPTDAHYAWCVGVDDDDTVFITGNHHDKNDAEPDPTTTQMIQCNNVDDFDNPSSWSASSTSIFDACSSGGPSGYAIAYTYHWFDRDNNGVLFHFMSQRDDPSTSQGRDYIAFKRVSGSWSPIIGDGHFATTANTGPSDADRVYVTGIVIENDGGGDGIDRLHIAGIWRTNDSDATSQQAPWYVYADGPDYDVWYAKAVGGDVVKTMPLTWANRADAEVDTAPATSHSVYGAIGLDDDMNPMWWIEDEGSNTFLRVNWDNATGWNCAADTNYPGEMGEYRINNVRYLRNVTTGYQRLRNMDTGIHHYIGHSIPTSGDNLSPQPCPIRMRGKQPHNRLGKFWTCIPKGDTPKFYSFGNLV